MVVGEDFGVGGVLPRPGMEKYDDGRARLRRGISRQWGRELEGSVRGNGEGALRYTVGQKGGDKRARGSGNRARDRGRGRGHGRLLEEGDDGWVPRVSERG